MKDIWIVNPYGTLPSEGWRDYRSHMLAKALVNLGYKVTWFISEIEHRSKTRRAVATTHLPDNPQIRVVVLPAGFYSKNISLQRIRYEMSFGVALTRKAKTLTPPLAIVVAEPALFYSGSVMALSRQFGVPYIVDVLDLWPEMFKVLFPVSLRPWADFILFPLYLKRRNFLRAARAVTCASGDFAEVISKETQVPNLVCYLGIDLNDFYSTPAHTDLSLKIDSFVGDRVAVVYSGTIGEAYDIATVLDSIRRLSLSSTDLCFIFVGDGPLKDAVNELANDLPDVVLFLGKVNSQELPTIYSRCSIGLCSYHRGSAVSMPVKFYDYLAAGLCVLNSLQGEIGRIIVGSGCGINYEAGSSGDLLSKFIQLRSRTQLLEKRRNARLYANKFDSVTQHNLMARFINGHVESLRESV